MVEVVILKSGKWCDKAREGSSMKKYLIAILCGLIFTVAIGWAADTLTDTKNNYHNQKEYIL